MSRVIPKDGWGSAFTTDLIIDNVSDLFEKDESKKRRKEGFILYKEGHISTLQACQVKDIWWIKAVCDATQRTKKGNSCV
jgi:hypothetical protein